MAHSFSRVFRWSTAALAGLAALGAALSPAMAGQGSVTPAVEITTAGFGLSNQRSNLQSQITSANVAGMHLAYTIPTAAPVSATPLVANGHLYFADWGGNVYAADAQTGQILWQKQVEQPNTQWPWYGFLGAGALDNGVLIEASVEGNAFGIDPTTGAIRWQTRFTDQPTAGNNASLLAYNGRVYLGLQSVDEPLSTQPGFQPSGRGGVVALDTQTGAKVWEKLLVDPPANGVAVWSSFALDPTTNMLFFDTGNNYTGQATSLSDSMIAANAATGSLIWSQQATQNDLWTIAQPQGPDADFGGGPQLFDATINGQVQHLVGGGQKSGAYRAYDRMTGQQVWASLVGGGGVNGGVRGEASIGTDRLFVWSNDGKTGGTPPDHPITVAALDLATGKTLWSVPSAQPAIGQSGGFLANDVYFVGSLDGTIKGYRAADGQAMMTMKAPGSVASSLFAQGDALLLGTGVPAMFGGTGTSGVSVYTVSTTGAPHL